MPDYTNAGFPTDPTGGNPMDPSAIQNALQQNYAALGVSPTGPGTGPTDLSYYAGQIANTGGLTPSNFGYWFGPTGRVASDVGGAGSAGGAAGGLGGGGSYSTSMFSTPFNAPAPFNLQPYAPPPAFTPPTPGQVGSDPGYQFALQQGLGAISNNQAAQGLWNTGATGKAMTGYAENLANTYYGDYYNRALQTYMANLGSQYTQPYDYYLQGQQLGANINNQNFLNQLNLWSQLFGQKYTTGNFLMNYGMA